MIPHPAYLSFFTQDEVDLMLPALRAILRIEAIIKHPERFGDSQEMLHAIAELLRHEGFLQGEP